MSNVLRSLVVKTGVDLTGAQKGMAQLGKDLKKAGKDMTNTGMSLTKGLTLPILGAAVASVKFASDLEESTNKVNVAFKESSGQVKDFSTTTLKSFGIAKGTALDMASTFGDMGTAMGQIPSTAADMSTSLVGLAGDMASFKNISLEQASTALRGIYTGEGEALKTLGVVMQDSTLIAYAQANGYKKLYKEMNQSEKVALRYAFVMDATTSAQGDFGRTSEGVANQTRMVQESLKEAAASIGQFLLPMVAKGAQGVNGLIEKFTSLDDSTKKNIIGFGAVAAGIGPAVTVMGHLTTGAGNLASKIAATSKAISGGAGLVPSLGKMIGPGGIATLAVVAIAGVAAILMKQTEATRKARQEVNKFVSEVEASATAYDEQSASIKTNASVALDLTSKLEKLERKTNKSNAEQEEMARIVSQLNELVPDLNLAIDEQTGLLNQQVGEVRDLIGAKREQFQEQADEERYVELLKQQADNLDKIREAETRVAIARNIFKSTGKSVFAYIAELKSSEKDLQSLKDTQGEVGGSLKLLDDQFEGSAVKMQKVREDEIWDIRESIKIKQGLTEEEAKAQEESSEESLKKEEAALKEADRVRRAYYKTEQDMLDDFQESVKANQDRMTGDYEEYASTKKSLTEQHLSEMGGLDQDGIEKSKLTAKQIKHNLRQQIKDFQEWRADIQKLSARVPEDVMNELRALGPSAQPFIEELNNMSDKQLLEYVALFRGRTAEAVGAAEEEAGKLPGAMYIIGADGVARLREGLMSGLPGIKEAARALARGASIGELHYKVSTTQSGMAAYAEGTNYVPRTGPAILHVGEAVIPAAENQGRSGIDYDKLGASVARALEGLSIKWDGNKFAELAAEPIRRVKVRRNMAW